MEAAGICQLPYVVDCFRAPRLKLYFGIGGKRTHRQVLPIKINGIGIARDAT
jgi:hypothetical protein